MCDEPSLRANGYLMYAGNTMYDTMAVKVAKLWPPKVDETKAKLGIWPADMDSILSYLTGGSHVGLRVEH